MKVLTGLALLIGLAACGPRANRETGAAADTTLTTRQTQDTAIVTSDTSVKVNVDTVKKEGDKAVSKDSLKVKH